jgi:hypothetical protein
MTRLSTRLEYVVAGKRRGGTERGVGVKSVHETYAPKKGERHPQAESEISTYEKA